MKYSERQRKRMERMRSTQLKLANDSGSLVSCFIEILREEISCTHSLRYFMTWLKFELDDLSTKTLQPLYSKINDKRKELTDCEKRKDGSAEKNCQQQLKKFIEELADHSFGIEHLLREVGQIYETVSSNENESLVRDLPQIGAQLLHDGFPLELLDGDASHIPQKWISAVLNRLADILRQKSGYDPNIIVLSVLGIQSSGKSTLLNTVFGVQFNVGAGRCTRGVFMQLIPIHPSLYEETGVQYILLIDTEGLRPPELNRADVNEHDNELATFVIGIAHLTLINVVGEVTGDIDDIVHTAVHAFLRMSQVELKPSCHIIHQHVLAVGADDKMSVGRYKTKENLDRATKAAAEKSGLGGRYNHFSDVITFDTESNVSFFPHLWNGKPPMARVSSEYSEEAQNFKMDIISYCGEIANYQDNTVYNIKKHTEQLWKAILQEDFVFTFQNTFEIFAYKELEQNYSEWSCCFMRDMSMWEQDAEAALSGCSPEKLNDMYEHLIRSLKHFANETHKKYENEMKGFFSKSSDIMLKWQPEIEPRLHDLCNKLQDHARCNCDQVYHAQKYRAEAEAIKVNLSSSFKQKCSS